VHALAMWLHINAAAHQGPHHPLCCAVLLCCVVLYCGTVQHCAAQQHSTAQGVVWTLMCTHIRH
jgi:hypothetical protein